MTTSINIGNSGAEIVSTDFWQSEYSRHGIYYLSANAGVLRLLVPTDQAATIRNEIQAAVSVTIEPSLQLPDAYDVVFEDGTDMPFFVSITKKTQCDRSLTPGKTKITVYFSLSDHVTFNQCNIV